MVENTTTPAHPETRQPDASLFTGQLKPPGDLVSDRCPSTDDVLKRAARILVEGMVQPADYLPVPEEVRQRVERDMAAVREKCRVEPSPQLRRRQEQDHVLEYHYAGREVACLRTEDGVIPLAVGHEQIAAFLSHIPPDKRVEVCIEFPEVA
jgi:hypothetical protein